MWLLYNRQLALKALNERLKSVPAGTTWPAMEDETETVDSEHTPSPPAAVATAGHVDTSSLTLPVATDVNTDAADTPVAVAAVSSTASEAHEQQQ